MTTLTTNLEIAIKLNNHLAVKALLAKINDLGGLEDSSLLQLEGLGKEIKVVSQAAIGKKNHRVKINNNINSINNN